jgi:hypothetical protein
MKNPKNLVWICFADIWLRFWTFGFVWAWISWDLGLQTHAKSHVSLEYKCRMTKNYKFYSTRIDFFTNRTLCVPYLTVLYWYAEKSSFRQKFGL